MNEVQIEMFAQPARSTWRERPDLWNAVLFLRARGYKVFRVSNEQSKFNRHLVSNRELRRIAKELGWSKI